MKTAHESVHHALRTIVTRATNGTAGRPRAVGAAGARDVEVAIHGPVMGATDSATNAIYETMHYEGFRGLLGLRGLHA